MTDELILRRAKGGDSAAFEQLMTPLEPQLWRLCWRYAGNMEDAKDCLQETMVKLWRSLGSFRGDSALETWAYRLCVNCCLDLVRKLKRQTADSTEEMQEAGFDPPDPAPGPEESTLKKEHQARLRKALDDLPEDMRTALILTQLEGCSYEAAAEILQVKTGTVKSRINRAREKLSKLFADGAEQSATANVQHNERRAGT